jgi:hypothetical protein
MVRTAAWSSLLPLAGSAVVLRRAEGVLTGMRDFLRRQRSFPSPGALRADLSREPER